MRGQATSLVCSSVHLSWTTLRLRRTMTPLNTFGGFENGTFMRNKRGLASSIALGSFHSCSYNYSADQAKCTLRLATSASACAPSSVRWSSAADTENYQSLRRSRGSRKRLPCVKQGRPLLILADTMSKERKNNRSPGSVPSHVALVDGSPGGPAPAVHEDPSSQRPGIPSAGYQRLFRAILRARMGRMSTSRVQQSQRCARLRRIWSVGVELGSLFA